MPPAPLYRGKVMLLSELLAHPAAEGVGFNQIGDAAYEDWRNTEHYWVIQGGNIVAGDRDPTARWGYLRADLPYISVTVIRPSAEPWNAATAVLPPVGDSVSVTHLMAYGRRINGVVLINADGRTKYRLEYNRPDAESNPDEFLWFHYLDSVPQRRNREAVYSTAQRWKIHSLPSPEEQARLNAPQPDEMPIPQRPPLSPESPGCPVCLRRNVFSNNNGDMTAWLNAHGANRIMAHRTVQYDATSPRCNGDRAASAIPYISQAWCLCSRCGEGWWRSDMTNGQCRPCQGRKVRISTEGAQPEDLRFGSELETEGISYGKEAKEVAQKYKGFQAKPDGSLRGASAEVTTPPLAFNQRNLDTLMEVARNLRRAGSRGTARCGNHVHVGVEDLTTRQICSLVEWWWLFEPAVLAAIPTGGSRASFCRPLQQAHRDKAKRAYDYNSRENLFEVNPGRYWALNVSGALSSHGTVEFRLYNGTVHATKACAHVALSVHTVSHASRNLLVPNQQAVERFAPTRDGMLKVLDTVGITNPSYRWHLLGRFQTEEDRPHGPRMDLADVAAKKRNIPLTPRRVGTRGVLLTYADYFRLNMSCLAHALEDRYTNTGGDITTRLERWEDWLMVNRLSPGWIPNRQRDGANFQDDHLMAVTYRDYDQATRDMRQS